MEGLSDNEAENAASVGDQEATVTVGVADKLMEELAGDKTKAARLFRILADADNDKKGHGKYVHAAGHLPVTPVSLKASGEQSSKRKEHFGHNTKTGCPETPTKKQKTPDNT
jgi:hypothetical protein